MAWTDQCQVAFSTNAMALYLQQDGRKNLTKILKKLSSESGIPYNTLRRWWYEQERINNDTGEEGVENIAEKKAEVPAISDRPICYACKKYKVEIESHSGKPSHPGTAAYGLCGKCRKTKTKIKKIDLNACQENGVMAVCPKCSHIFYINKERINQGEE